MTAPRHRLGAHVRGDLIRFEQTVDRRVKRRRGHVVRIRAELFVVKRCVRRICAGLATATKVLEMDVGDTVLGKRFLQCFA